MATAYQITLKSNSLEKRLTVNVVFCIAFSRKGHSVVSSQSWLKFPESLEIESCHLVIGTCWRWPLHLHWQQA